MIKKQLQVTGIVVLLLVVSIAAAALVLASVPGQGAILPTPTPYPIEAVDYELTVVGGESETFTFSYPDQDGFVLGATTVTSQYPRGMVFTIDPQSANGAIQDVILFMRYAHGSGTRVTAEWDPDRNAWVAHPWATGEGQPAWTHFDFYWRVRDDTGAAVDTAPVPMDYSDPTREWYRFETPYYIVYWFGMSDDKPQRFAEQAAYSIATTHPRRLDGFGESLSYKPTGVIYGSRAALNEMTSSGVSDTTAGGYTSNELGMSVQYVPSGSTQHQIDWLSHVLTHELVHLYQYDVVGGATGPNWWTEGQAEWFGFSPGAYDERLMNLAKMQDFPTLSKEVTRNLVQADGRPYLVYDMGASFVNWLITTYGVETHAATVERMKQGIPFYTAIEEVTGQPFLEIENQWRTYIGLEPLELADIDPAAALQPIDSPPYDVGDTVTLPPMPALPAVYESPGLNAPYTGQCFANTQVTILASGALNGDNYYQVDCMGQIGWMPEELLAGP